MLLALALVAAILMAVIVLLFRSLASRAGLEAVPEDSPDSFALENYAPMERLLDRSDFEFLARQPGYRPVMARRLLEQRRRVFRDYLRHLIQDFNRLHASAKLSLVYTAQDSPELAKSLWREQMQFYYAVFVLRCRVVLYPWGWTGVEIRKLAQPLETMRAGLLSRPPEQAASPR